jgi:hypothetical protein
MLQCAEMLHVLAVSQLLWLRVCLAAMLPSYAVLLPARVCLHGLAIAHAMHMLCLKCNAPVKHRTTGTATRRFQHGRGAQHTCSMPCCLLVLLLGQYQHMIALSLAVVPAACTCVEDNVCVSWHACLCACCLRNAAAHRAIYTCTCC